MLFYAVELLVLGAAFHAWLRDRKPDPTVQSVRPAGLPAEGTAPIE